MFALFIFRAINQLKIISTHSFALRLSVSQSSFQNFDFSGQLVTSIISTYFSALLLSVRFFCILFHVFDKKHVYIFAAVIFLQYTACNIPICALILSKCGWNVAEIAENGKFLSILHTLITPLAYLFFEKIYPIISHILLILEDFVLILLATAFKDWLILLATAALVSEL